MKKLFLLIIATLLFAPWQLNAQVKNSDQTKDVAPNLTDANGNKNGLWSEKEGDVTWKGEYIANKKVKNWVGYYPNNYISKVEYYTNGWKDGVNIQFDRKGKVTLIENYKNDKLDGQTIYYGVYTETPLSETEYYDGKKNGLFRQYYDNGKIQEETWFKGDRKNGLSRWNNKAGQRIAEYNYVLGNFEGIQKTFYENDSLQSYNIYINNKLSGEAKEYYRNGKVKLSGKYIDGLKEGAWTEYDELGKIQRMIKYKNGQELTK